MPRRRWRTAPRQSLLDAAAGSIAIVRAEEVLCRHGRCLAAAGRDGETEAALERALFPG